MCSEASPTNTRTARQAAPRRREEHAEREVLNKGSHGTARPEYREFAAHRSLPRECGEATRADLPVQAPQLARSSERPSLYIAPRNLRVPISGRTFRLPETNGSAKRSITIPKPTTGPV